MNAEIIDLLSYLKSGLESNSLAVALNAVDELAEKLPDLRSRLREALDAEYVTRLAAVTGPGATHDWAVVGVIHCRRCRIGVLGPHVAENGQLPACADVTPCTLGAHVITGVTDGLGQCIFCKEQWPARSLQSEEVPVR